jgi:hypothetical protein
MLTSISLVTSSARAFRIDAVIKNNLETTHALAEAFANAVKAHNWQDRILSQDKTADHSALPFPLVTILC